MRISRLLPFAVAATLAFAAPCLAFRAGPPAARTGSPESLGATCRLCHGNAVGAGSVQIIGAPAAYSPNEQWRITAGIKNLFDTDPPFAITYDSNTGAGSSWEPRVADPRGRSFTLMLEYKM